MFSEASVAVSAQFFRGLARPGAMFLSGADAADRFARSGRLFAPLERVRSQPAFFRIEALRNAICPFHAKAELM